MDRDELAKRGVSIRRVLLVLFVLLLVISGMLLAATGGISRVNANLNQNIENYKQWQRNASDLQVGSDYLTEQVRCFVVTGDRTYLDNYFEEVNVTRRRDKAVESVRGIAGDTEAYQALATAMAESQDLMSREYYAMRLAAVGYGLDLATFPEEVRSVELTADDRAKTEDQQRETALHMVHDELYRGKKQTITSHIQECMTAIDGQIEASQTAAQTRMHNTIRRQRIMIIVSIVATIASIAVLLSMLVWPLLKAVDFIQKDQAMPVLGSEEFRFLAKEYNIAHQANVEQRQELTYEATHDNLTGLYNRNGYDSVRQSLEGSSYALVLFDLDEFKSVNDQYGHLMGDRVLARAARVIRNAFRAQDYVCRIGGDEFVVIMLYAATGADDIIRDKVSRINDELAQPEGDIPGVHVSSGASFSALSPDFDALFGKADAALYRVKRQGGGGCEVAR